jgi:hypothetical protein
MVAVKDSKPIVISNSAPDAVNFGSNRYGKNVVDADFWYNPTNYTLYAWENTGRRWLTVAVGSSGPSASSGSGGSGGGTISLNTDAITEGNNNKFFTVQRSIDAASATYLRLNDYLYDSITHGVKPSPSNLPSAATNNGKLFVVDSDQSVYFAQSSQWRKLLRDDVAASVYATYEYVDNEIDTALSTLNALAEALGAEGNLFDALNNLYLTKADASANYALQSSLSASIAYLEELALVLSIAM